MNSSAWPLLCRYSYSACIQHWNSLETFKLTWAFDKWLSGLFYALILLKLFLSCKIVHTCRNQLKINGFRFYVSVRNHFYFSNWDEMYGKGTRLSNIILKAENTFNNCFGICKYYEQISSIDFRKKTTDSNSTEKYGNICVNKSNSAHEMWARASRNGKTICLLNGFRICIKVNWMWGTTTKL